MHNKHKTKKQNINDSQKKYRLGTVSENILLEGLNQFHSANLTLNSDQVYPVVVFPNIVLYYYLFMKPVNPVVVFPNIDW